MIVAGFSHFLMYSSWSVGGLAKGWLVQDGLTCMTRLLVGMMRVVGHVSFII